MPDTHKIFVYGTLKNDGPNNRLLAGSTFISEGETAKRYRMYSNSFFPMIIPDRTGYKISGELFRVSQDTLEQLDALEGHPHHYYRDATTIIDSDGKKVMAWVYIYANKIVNQTEITTGNWRVDR